MALAAHLELPSVFGEPTLTPEGGANLRDANAQSPLQYTVKYLNYLPVDVGIAWRNGMKFTLPAQYNEVSQCLVVRIEIVIPSLVNINADRLLSVVQEHCSAEVRLLKVAVDRANQAKPWQLNRGVNLHVEYAIDLNELRQYGGSVYFHDLDTVVSLNGFNEIPEHPSSENAITSTVCATQVPADVGRFGFSVLMIDNRGVQGDRFIGVAGKVFRIPVTRVAGMIDGVYVTWNGCVDSELAIPSTAAERYTFDQADEEFGLYKSYAQALSGGDVALARKEELAAKQHEIELIRTHAQADKIAADREQLRVETELKTANAAREALQKNLDAALAEKAHAQEMKKLQEKDHYESRSYERKDSSETLKFLPAIIVGIGSIFLAVKAFL